MAIDSTHEEVRYDPEIGKRRQEKMEIKAKDKFDKMAFLIKQMSRYSDDCSLKFLSEPNRISLKFEKSFTMAIKQSKDEVLNKFPAGSIKTCYINYSHLNMDHKTYKLRKRQKTQDLITTPLHLAC